MLRNVEERAAQENATALKEVECLEAYILEKQNNIDKIEEASIRKIHSR